MTNKKTTKRALLSSVLSLVLCLTMLIGTTFAWFTDSVTSSNNIIKSGNLKVTMEWMDGKLAVADDDSTSWKDASTDAIFDYDLWEPGYVSVRHVKIANEGSLALKYKLNIIANGTVSDLADVIDVYYVDPAKQIADRTALSDDMKIGTLTDVLANLETTGTGALEAGKSDVVTIALKMQESAGNEYQDKSIGTNFSVQLLATQFTAEEDSFDKYYDEDAIYYDVKVTNAAELEAAINAGEKIIALDGNIALTKSLGANGVTFVAFGKDASLDFGTYGISGNGNTFKNLSLDNDRDGWYKGMQYSDGENTTYADCTFVNGVTTYGNSTFKNCTFNELPAGNYALFVYDGATVVVDGCTFNYGNRAIKIYNEGYQPDIQVSVSNTAFKASATTVANKAMIEIDDSLMNSVKVTVEDITIDSAIAAQGVYRINDGALDTSTAKSVVSVDGVVTTAEASNQTEFSEALAAGSEVAVELSAGTYTIPSTAANKDITIVGDGDNTVFDFTKVNTATNASITFENVKFQGKNENVMNGFGIQGTSGHIAYKNCTFDGAVTNEYYGTVSYEDCTFTGTGYITTYAVKSATFENCIFDKADSRAVLVYSHGDNPVVVSIKGCTFKAAAKATTWSGDWTAAIEVDTTNIPTAGTTVTVEKCTHDENYSGLVRDKSAANATKAVIKINGVTQ